MATTSRVNTVESPAERQLDFDQVEDLLKLQKAAQKSARSWSLIASSIKL